MPEVPGGKGSCRSLCGDGKLWRAKGPCITCTLRPARERFPSWSSRKFLLEIRNTHQFCLEVG